MLQYWTAVGRNRPAVTIHWFVLLVGIWLPLILAACGGSVTAEPEPTLPSEVVAGKQLFQVHCASCHVTEGDAVIVGPSLTGIATRAGERVAGLDAQQYIELSILQPEAYLVEGFENLMPSTLGKQLTGEELDALVAYLLILE